MRIFQSEVAYTQVPAPVIDRPNAPVDITDETMIWRKERVLRRMQRHGLDVLVVYGDREHGANFGYLCGFEPRFEEAALVLHKNGDAYMLLGNESLHMIRYSRIRAQAIHVPFFSLPNQPMENERDLTDVVRAAQIEPGHKVGIAGWKMFTSRNADNDRLFDVPHFIVQAVMLAAGEDHVKNACHIFIDPEDGARIAVNANEIAHYEFGAALASDCVLRVLDAAEVGRTELELAEYLSAYGQPITVQTICATGERFINAVVAPRNKAVRLGDKFSATMGLRGGLTNRVAYVAETEADLPRESLGYIDRAVKPYFAAAATWYSTMGIGVTGGELYDAVDAVCPKIQYGWKLNPGHYTSSEEWMSSPIAKGSSTRVRSGMMFQMDIILNVPGCGINGEDGIAIADESLRSQIENQFPMVWERIRRRRQYMTETLGIPLKEEILPLSDSEGYVRPFLLAKDRAMKVM